MIRLLIIGRPADEWAPRLQAAVATALEVDTARLPSAGIRQFEQTPADLIIVADDRGGHRVETLARAIRRRPLGELIPLMMICPRPDAADLDKKTETLDLVGWLPPEAEPSAVIAAIEQALDVDLSTSGPDPDDGSNRHNPSPQATAPDADHDGQASYFDGQIVLEPMDEPSGPRPRSNSPRPSPSKSHRSPFRSGSTSATSGSGGDAPLNGDEIERTLKAVRHEDYYAILRLRRGAETQQVRQAFHHLFARFDPDTIDFDLVRQFQDELDEIRDAFEDAFAVLGDPDLREQYLHYTLH